MDKFGKVAVLMGGKSHEREVSLWSGEAVLNALLRQNIDAHKVDVGDDIIEKLKMGKFNRAFNVLHGRGGEDGVIQSVLELLKIPYTGSDIISSALSMDKIKTKEVWQNSNLPTLPFVILNDKTNFNEVIQKFSLPVCVKPSREGSTYGVIKVIEANQLPKAYQEDLQYDDLILAEPWITGREFTIAILENQVLPIIEIVPEKGFYDFNAKYLSNETKFYCPADLPKDKTRYMQELAVMANRALGCSGWSRVDFLLDQKGNAWLTEVNTVPGMTEHSLVPLAAKTAGISFDELVVKILETSFIAKEFIYDHETMGIDWNALIWDMLGATIQQHPWVSAAAKMTKIKLEDWIQGLLKTSLS